MSREKTKEELNDWFMSEHNWFEERLGLLNKVYGTSKASCPSLYDILNSPKVDRYLKIKLPKLEPGQINLDILDKHFKAAFKIVQGGKWQHEESGFCAKMQLVLIQAKKILGDTEQEKIYQSWLESKYPKPNTPPLERIEELFDEEQKLEQDEPSKLKSEEQFDKRVDQPEEPAKLKHHSDKENSLKPIYQFLVVSLALVSVPILAAVAGSILLQLFRSNLPTSLSPLALSSPSPSSSSISIASDNKLLDHTAEIPVGSYSYYEKSLHKQVSYIRNGNKMVGALYDSQQPDTITCFTATIGNNQVDVTWWNNLWQINHQEERLDRTYSIDDFTIDNIEFKQGLDNPTSVQKCRNQA